MSVDVRIIIGHNLNIKEVISFPKILDNCQELKSIFINEIQSKLDHNYSIEQVLIVARKESNWERVNENDILKSWINNSDPKAVSENGYLAHSLSTYFGSLYFNKQTIEVVYYPEHKYANLFYESSRSFMLQFSNSLAKLLGQTKIVYCNDTTSTSIIVDEATEGKSIDEIINNAILNFGLPSKLLSEAIAKHFFIDDINDSIQNFVGNMYR
jgi:hypothetical protein